MTDLTRFGFAPGRYFCLCRACEQQFEGDKRATACEQCANEAADAVRAVLVRRYGDGEGNRLFHAGLAKWGRVDSSAYAKWVDAAKEAMANAD
jgi:hypothetical protein